MSLFGSLFTGVSALSAQSQSIGIIANNIANVSTTGYKRNSSAFGSLVTTSGNSTIYNPGSVRTTRVQNIDQQGALQQTASATDLAISGNGFFVVQKAVDGIQETFYTRAGDFKENAQGFLVNSNGLFLKGWLLDENGNLPASQADISSLQPIDVAFVGGFTKPTSQASLALNLKANEEPTSFPVPSGTPVDFTRGLRVFDTLGAAQDLTFEYVKSVAPTANATSTVAGLELSDVLIGNVAGLANGDQFSVAIGTNPATTITISTGDTVQTLLTSLNAITGLEARLNSDGQIFLQASDVSQNLTIADVTGTPAADLGFSARASVTTSVTGLTVTSDMIASFAGLADGDSVTLTVGGVGPTSVTVNTGDTVQDFLNDLNAITGVNATLTTAGSINITTDNPSTSLVIANGVGGAATDIGIDGTTAIAAIAPDLPTIFPGGTASTASLLNAPNSQGWWQIQVKNAAGVVISGGYINFNGDGTLNAIEDAEGEKKITLNNIDWGNGSDPQDIDVLIDRFTQFSGNYNVLFSDQNGAELGLRTGIEIDEDGIVFARFSNGQSSALYKLPLATFTNENGLEEVSGVVYRETSLSGSFNLRESNQGGAGEFQSGALENSNVDLADEFSKMIVTQRAYSAGTKVITTVDSMTEELLRLR